MLTYNIKQIHALCMTESILLCHVKRQSKIFLLTVLRIAIGWKIKEHNLQSREINNSEILLR